MHGEIDGALSLRYYESQRIDSQNTLWGAAMLIMGRSRGRSRCDILLTGRPMGQGKPYGATVVVFMENLWGALAAMFLGYGLQSLHTVTVI